MFFKTVLQNNSCNHKNTFLCSVKTKYGDLCLPNKLNLKGLSSTLAMPEENDIVLSSSISRTLSMNLNLGGCIQSLLLMTFTDLKSIGVFNTDF